MTIVVSNNVTNVQVSDSAAARADRLLAEAAAAQATGVVPSTTGIIRATSITNLRTNTPVDGQAAYVTGYYTAGDGGGGTFRGVTSGGPYTDNGGTIIVPGGGSGTKAWLRIYDNEVSVKWFGAKGDNVADDSSAFQTAANVATKIVIPHGTYKIGTPIALSANAEIVGSGSPILQAVTNGQDIMSASGVSSVTVTGVSFVGTSATTTPSNNPSGYGVTVTGLLTITNCSDVKVENCTFSTFYNGICVLKCPRAWIKDNYVSSYYFYGILASLSTYFQIDQNVITGCAKTSSGNAYGIMATGDYANSKPTEFCSISHNKIKTVQCWDGIMTHDIYGLIIDGNDIRDVRTGIDIGHYDATNIVKNIIVTNNYIESTSVDAWSGSAANSCGIEINGYDDTYRIEAVTIANNIIRNFYTASGMTGSGNPSNITIVYADAVTVTGNVVLGVGSQISNAGIFVVGTVNKGLTITGNSLQGAMVSGGIRLSGVTANAATITGNSIVQSTSTIEALLVNNSTISAFQVSANATNSSVPWYSSSNSLTVNGTEIIGAADYNPASTIATGSGVTTTVTVPGAALGDFATASYSINTSGMLVTAYAIGTDTVAVRFQNQTGSTIDLTSGTVGAGKLRVYLRKLIA